MHEIFKFIRRLLNKPSFVNLFRELKLANKTQFHLALIVAK